jgi:hypothetical protein
LVKYALLKYALFINIPIYKYTNLPCTSHWTSSTASTLVAGVLGAVGVTVAFGTIGYIIRRRSKARKIRKKV